MSNFQLIDKILHIHSRKTSHWIAHVSSLVSQSNWELWHAHFVGHVLWLLNWAEEAPKVFCLQRNRKVKYVFEYINNWVYFPLNVEKMEANVIDPIGFVLYLKSARPVGLSWWLHGKTSTCQCRRNGFNPWVGKILWRSKWQPTPVFLPGKSFR